MTFIERHLACTSDFVAEAVCSGVQEVHIMQTLSDIAELVKCFPYSPQPRPQSKSALHICQLVMELMEVTASPIAFSASENAWQFSQSTSTIRVVLPLSFSARCVVCCLMLSLIESGCSSVDVAE